VKEEGKTREKENEGEQGRTREGERGRREKEEGEARGHTDNPKLASLVEFACFVNAKLTKSATFICRKIRARRKHGAEKIIKKNL
jgi:hypothetical protein